MPGRAAPASRPAPTLPSPCSSLGILGRSIWSVMGMGQAILYCYRCSTQLRNSHFEQGKAYRIDSRVCCTACAPEAVRSLPPDLVQLLLTQIAAKEKRSSSSSPGARPPASRPAAPPPSRISSPQFKILMGAAGAALCGVVAAVVLLSGG